MGRRGDARGMLGWPQKPRPPVNQNIRLHVKCDARGHSQLDLSHRGLVYIPLQVFQFQQLDVLKLSHNRLDQLPPMVSYLRGIRTLHLQHNLLTALPPTLVNCRHLSELDLSDNRLTSLPKGLQGLKALRVLKLANNQLEQIPHELGSLSNLRVLDLHGNRLWYLPFSLQHLYHLLRLDLSDNLLDQIPLVVTKLTWLRALDVCRNRLATLPPDFDQLRELRELNLSENRFVTVGVMATKLRQLKYLSVAHNRLQFLPDQIAALKNLRVLHLQDNSLESLPDDFPHLKYLNMAHNKLACFSVLRMTDLAALDASHNKLETLPRGVYRLKNLKRLNLAQNLITEVPEDIGWLRKLQSLDLSENDLRSLPAALHFMEKLTSFNVRGNHKISRVTLPHHKQQAEATVKENQARPSTRAADTKSVKSKLGQNNKLRQYASMPSLHHPPSSKKEATHDLLSKSRTSSVWPQADASQHDRTWLDNFLYYRPQPSRRRASWDANMTLRTARSVPYPLDDRYETGEIRASFSAESVSSQEKRYHYQDPMSVMSFASDHYDDDDDDEDSALEASFSSTDCHHHGHGGTTLEGSQWLLDYKKVKSSHKNLKKSTFTTMSSKSAVNFDDEKNQKKILSSTAGSAKAKSFNDDDTAVKKVPPSHTSTSKTASHRSSRTEDQTERKVAYNSASNLRIYDYDNGEGRSSEARQMRVLKTSESQPNSRHSTLRKKKPAASKGTQMLKSSTNWTLRSHLSEPLTIQTWTQTAPQETNVHSATQTPGVSDRQGGLHSFAALRSPDSPPMMRARGVQSQENFELRHQSLGNHSPFQHSPASSSSLHPSTSDTGANISSTTHAASHHGLDPNQPSRTHTAPGRSTDYTLLGVCNHIQTQLHRDLLQPVIGFNGQHTGRFSNKAMRRGDSGALHDSHTGGANSTQAMRRGDSGALHDSHTGGANSNKAMRRGDSGALHDSHTGGANSTQGAGLEAGLEYSPGETFTATETGGHFVSTFCQHVQVSVPPGAVNTTLHVTLQQLTISSTVLKAISNSDSYVSNILSIGPILFLNALEKVTFASPVTLTLPAPGRVKGHPGHLVVVSVCHDNTCIPCTTAYQSSKREVTLTTWHMTGKVAVVTKAKCKYKACKSVEQLLASLNIIAINAAQHAHF
ncbi:uncharacterized protein [Littorina saxatilis]|uniref:uncharacterized protein n=1 Tax=Littorina saxatilis TaxID=31220 RepID=UPI0038B47327